MSHPPTEDPSTVAPSDVPERQVCGCGRKRQEIRNTPSKDRSVLRPCPAVARLKIALHIIHLHIHLPQGAN